MIDVAIGLEVHVQLATSLKLFCADRNAPRSEPNTQVCPVCLGLPGALPVLDPEAIDLALRAAVALGCTVEPVSRFERKSYFYPDLPKGFQITQHAQPLARGGYLTFAGPEGTLTVALQRVHVEEDAGRLLHDRFDGLTAIDFNRAGVPLIEIVTEPQLQTGTEARAFLTRLRQTLRHTGVSECDMESGTLRVDANVSLRAGGTAGERVEIKNLNSFAHVEKAIAHEIARQRDVLAAGGRVERETRAWQAATGTTRLLRAKEAASDYRYVPEPDLPLLVVPAADVENARDELPELPAARERRFAAAYGLPARDIAVLTAEPDIAAFYEDLVAAGADPADAAGWTLGPVLAWLNRTGSRVASVQPQRVAELIELIAAGGVSRTAARFVFDQMLETDVPVTEVLARSALGQVSDEAAVRTWVAEVIAGHPQEFARLQAGDTRMQAYLMGEVMRRSQGRANPHAAARILAERTAT